MSQGEFADYQGNAGPGYHTGGGLIHHGYPGHQCIAGHCPQYGSHYQSGAQQQMSSDQEFASQSESHRNRLTSDKVPIMTGRFAHGGHHHQRACPCGEVRVHDHTHNDYGQPIIVLHTVLEPAAAPQKPAEITWKFSEIFADPVLVSRELNKLLEGGRHKIVSIKIEEHKHESPAPPIEYLFKVEISVPTAAAEVKLYEKLRVGISPPGGASESVTNYTLVNLFMKILYKTIKLE